VLSALNLASLPIVMSSRIRAVVSLLEAATEVWHRGALTEWESGRVGEKNEK